MAKYSLSIAAGIALVGILIIGLVVMLNSPTQGNEISGNSSQLKIAVTFFPLAQIAKNVAPDARIVSLVPSGIEPHDYEPSTGEIISLSSSDVFIVIGFEFSELENKLANANSNIKLINSANGIKLISASGEEAQNGQLYDPHVWVSPKNMILMTENVANELAVIDPKNARTYRSNAETYTAKLNALDAQYLHELSNCTKDTIMVSHNAFSYLAKDYNFSALFMVGFAPDVEPSANQLASLIEAARAKQLKYIFYEELVDPKVSQTIARETGAQTLELSPLEGSKNPRDTYISIMQNNLNNLKLALECQ